MRVRRLTAVFLCLMVVAVLWAGRAHARPVGSKLAVCIAPVSAAPSATEAFAGRGFDCNRAQHHHGPGDFWVLSAPVPEAASRGKLSVRINSLWQRGLTLHALYADGKVRTLSVDSAGLWRHVQLGAILAFDLPVRDAKLVRLLWRVDGAANARGVLLGQRIASEADAARANMEMAAIYSGFAGLAIALIFYNLALWFALRHPFQLVYCAMVAALLVYAVSSSGALAWLIPIDNNDRIRLNYTMLGCSMSAAILFARSFFEPRVFEGWLGPVTAGAAAIPVLSGVGFAIASAWNMPLADRICSWTFLGGVAISVPILWRAATRGSRYLWFFAIAWAAPILFAGTRVLSGLRILPINFWIDNSTVLSMGLEALLSSVAIAYRVQMLSRERDEARARETLARQLADIDPLTGLLNRRALLTAAIGRTGVQTLHVIDVDRFKTVNETLGHDGGDEVLRLVARTLRTTVPAGALVSRLGGEEFAIVAGPNDGIDPDRLLNRLRATPMPFDLTVTASIGSCTGPLGDETDWKRLYHAADRALFDAKAAGRDRVRQALPLARAA